MEIVKKQHIFPAKSISRFYDSNGAVEVNLIPQLKIFKTKILKTKSKDQIFTVNRAWDQKSEQGYGLKIEHSFQNLTDSVLKDEIFVLPPEANALITKFYMLWYSRSVITEQDLHLASNIKITDLQGVGLSDLEKEQIELDHGLYVNHDQTLPMHFQRGMVIKGTIDSFFDRNPNLKWYVCKSSALEFIVPDIPSKDIIIPISPSICYSCGVNFGDVTIEKMIELNRNAIVGSKNYYFGRSLARTLPEFGYCPNGN